jgi:catechol 2,3-dioxygenase-like lactoylglutathione lyase family enzyme
VAKRFAAEPPPFKGYLRAAVRPAMYLDYSGLRVTNLAKSVRFVTNGLGLVEIRRGRMGHGGVWVLFRDTTSHQQLELNWYPKGNPYATPFSPGEGLDHLGFRVNDIPAAARRVKAAGGRLLAEEREKGKVVCAFYEGPDGIWIELIWDPTV